MFVYSGMSQNLHTLPELHMVAVSSVDTLVYQSIESRVQLPQTAKQTVV
jgi:hypothetical protein